MNLGGSSANEPVGRARGWERGSGGARPLHRSYSSLTSREQGCRGVSTGQRGKVCREQRIPAPRPGRQVGTLSHSGATSDPTKRLFSRWPDLGEGARISFSPDRNPRTPRPGHQAQGSGTVATWLEGAALGRGWGLGSALAGVGGGAEGARLFAGLGMMVFTQETDTGSPKALRGLPRRCNLLLEAADYPLRSV